MYPDRFEDDDAFPGPTPWMRRPAVRVVVISIAVGSFLLATLVSSCGPRRRTPAPATTTIPVVEVVVRPPLPTLPMDA